MTYAKPLFALLASAAMLAPLPASAQRFPRLPDIQQPRLPSLPGMGNRSEDNSAQQPRTSPTRGPMQAQPSQAGSRELSREFSMDMQMLSNQINTTTISEDDNQRIDREVEEYRTLAERVGSDYYAAVPENQRATYMRGLELHYDGVARSTEREVEFAQGMITGIGRADAAYNSLRVHDTYLQAATLIFPGKTEYTSARAQTQAALAELGGSRAGAAAAENEAELAAARNVRMPASISNDSGLQSLFRRAWATSGIDWQIMRINVTSGWSDRRENGRIIGQVRDAAIAARDPSNPDRCNLYDFTMFRDTSGNVRRSSHSTRRIACENVPG